MLTCRRPQCIDTCTWWTEGPEPPPPPNPDLWEVVSRGGWDMGCVAVITFLYSVLFKARFAHLLWISLFSTLFTVNFKLKGSFNLTFSFPSHYKHSWLLWKDTIQFHLVYSYTVVFFLLKSSIFWERMVTSCIKLIEIGQYNLKKYSIGWSRWPRPQQTYFTVFKHIHCVCFSPSRRRHAFTPPTYMNYWRCI